jgi:hypothetical protein
MGSPAAVMARFQIYHSTTSCKTRQHTYYVEGGQVELMLGVFSCSTTALLIVGGLTIVNQTQYQFPKSMFLLLTDRRSMCYNLYY